MNQWFSEAWFKTSHFTCPKFNALNKEKPFHLHEIRHVVQIIVIFELDLGNSKSLNASYYSLKWKNVFELIDQSDYYTCNSLNADLNDVKI